MIARTAPPVSRVARDLLALIPDLPDMDEAELLATEARAARNFTACSLHASLPESEQGDTSRRAWMLRQEVQDAARHLWLAVQAEQRRQR